MANKLDRIINGDCIKQLAKLDEGSIDLVFADPPFNIGYDYDEYDDQRSCDDYLDWSKQWISGVKRVLKSDGAFWLAIGDDYAAELKVLATRELGFTCRSWVIWYYTFGVHCKNKFTRSHTHLFHFVKDPKKFTFNSLDIRVPSARELVYGDKRADSNRRVPDDTWMMTPAIPPEVVTWDGFVLRPQDIPERFPPTSDTWFFSRVAGTFKERAGFHGCQMPEQLLGRIIKACSNEGDIVLDPFAGSGTTLAVAKKLDRRFIGFEISKKYTGMIQKRLAKIQPGDSLDGPENPALSAPSTNRGRRLLRRPAPVLRTVSESPIMAKVNVSLGQVAVANGELATAIAEAFLAAHQGYSSDRVLADPELNDSFLDNCRLLGIPGDAKDWNQLLLNIRKRGSLSPIDTSRRTMIRHSEMEPYQFASEIAWRKVSDEHACSLDDILCNPTMAQSFDRIASQIVPDYSSFQYRWAALSIRKEASKGNRLVDRVGQRLAPRVVCMPDRDCLPALPGHYLITAAETQFFVGYASSLRSCPLFERNCLGAALESMNLSVKIDRDVKIKTRNFDPAAFKRTGEEADLNNWRSARRAKLLLRYRPVANVPLSSSAA